MSTARYPIADVNPVPIYPGGKQGQVTIYNDSDNTVYVTSVASGIYPIPVDGRQSIRWDSQSPLYAFVQNVALPAAIIVMDTGVIMSPSRVAITGPVDANITGPVSVSGPITVGSVTQAVPIATRQTLLKTDSPSTLAGYDSGTVSTAGYNTVLITVAGIGSPTTINGVVKLWINTGGVGAYYNLPVSSDFGAAAVAVYQVPVAGPTVEVFAASSFGGVTGAFTISIYGLTQALPSKYETIFVSNGSWAGQTYSDTDFDLYQVTASAVQDYTGPVGHVSGLAQVNCFCAVSGTFAIKPYAQPSANVWAVTYTGGEQLSAQIYLPDTPVMIYFRPAAAAGLPAVANFTVVTQHK